MRAIVLGLALAALISGCGGSGAGAPTPIPQMGTNLERDVAFMRELELLRETEVVIVSRDSTDLAERAERLASRSEDSEEAGAKAIWLWLLRFTETPDLDLHQLDVDATINGATSFYDVERGQIVIVTDDLRPIGPSASLDDLPILDRVWVTSAIVNSLQDQHFAIKNEDLYIGSINDDPDFARWALVRGDALYWRIQYHNEILNAEEQKEFGSELDAYLAAVEGSDDFLKYYNSLGNAGATAGIDFVRHLILTGQVEAINAAILDPPQSTEQILHPTKYTSDPRDEPVDVILPDISAELGSGWRLAMTAIIGELDLRIMLELNGFKDGPLYSGKAAAGWGGSQLHFYTEGDDSVAVLKIVWDTPEDAVEFHDALVTTLEELEQSGDLSIDGGRYIGFSETEDAVLIVSGTDEEVVERALSQQS